MSVDPYEIHAPEQRGRFLNYQRLLENTLATWIRNGFISTTTGLVLIPHDKEISHCIFAMEAREKHELHVKTSLQTFKTKLVRC